MKKLFLLAVMAMMAIAVQADEEEFVVTSGDFNVVRQPGKTGRLEVDFTKAKVGNLSTMEITDQTFMDYLAANDQKVFKKWSEYQEEAIETFMERWNDAKKKVIKLTKKDTPDRYYHLWHIGGHRCCRQQCLQDEHQPLQRFLNERS